MLNVLKKNHIWIISAVLLLVALCVFPIWKIEGESEIFSHTEFYSVIRVLFAGFSSSKLVDAARYDFAVTPLFILFLLVLFTIGFICMCSKSCRIAGFGVMGFGVVSALLFDGISGSVESEALSSVGFSCHIGNNNYFFIVVGLLMLFCLVLHCLKTYKFEQVQAVNPPIK